jgi:deazaflavin-dependent oxidoreductase (nitroreductase family)
MSGTTYASAHPLHRFIRWLSTTRCVSWLLAPMLRHLDIFVLGMTGGRVSATEALAGLPVVVITTTGRLTGKLRSTPLVGIPDGNRLVVVASRFGSARHPGWYHNMRANPAVTVTCANRSAQYTAREVSGDEWQKYWQIASGMLPGYRGYRDRAGKRHIPIIVLAPSGE